VRFLVDECTGPQVARWLQGLSYEVFSVYDLWRGADDVDVLAKSASENWILITNDKDFGERVYREKMPHRGVIFLRLHDETVASKIDVLSRLLTSYAEQLPGRFVVVTETQVRFATV
jgi:predicted nuclease of predicted toxin-antitoxin system